MRTFLVGLLALGTLWGLLVTYLHFVNNPLPFPDRGSFIFTIRSNQERQVIIDLLGQHGLSPRFRADDPDVSRAIYPNGLILNVVSEELLERLGHPTGGFAIPSNNPMKDALADAKYLTSRGIPSRAIDEPHNEGKIAFVKMEGLPLVIVLRLPLFKMGKPPAWTDNPC